MSSLVYDNFIMDILGAAYDPGAVGTVFNVMLVTDSYVPNQGTDHYRQDVLNQANAEVANAQGYVAGGQQVTCTITLNASANQVSMAFSTPVWNSSSITARGAVLYHARGGAASADELVSYLDFGMDVTSSNGTFTAVFATPLIFNIV